MKHLKNLVSFETTLYALLICNGQFGDCSQNRRSSCVTQEMAPLTSAIIGLKLDKGRAKYGGGAYCVTWF